MDKQDKIQDIVLKKIMKTDDFIKILYKTNPGMLNIGNIWCFDYVLSHLPSKAHIIEIGAFCGLSANVITYLKLKHKIENKLICVEPWLKDKSNLDKNLADHPYIKKADYQNYVKLMFQQNVTFFSGYDLPFAIQLTSDNFFYQWEKKEIVNDIFEQKVHLGGEISFAYIDGKHSYDFVNRDFINVDKYLQIGGFILFDDSADNSNFLEVNKVVKEVCENKNYALINQTPNYLFKKIQHEGR